MSASNQQSRLYGGSTEVGPHDFEPLSRVLHRKKCRACYVAKAIHPVRLWVEARPLGDKREYPW